MSLTLKIQMVRLNQQKSMKFAPTMSVSEVIGQIKEKTNEGGDDHGLFQPGLEGKRPSRWLRLDRTLQYYDLKMNDLLEYKKKHRPLKVKLMDDTVKTVLVDDSLSVGEIVELIGKKMQIKNFEEFSLQRDTSAAAPTGKESKDTVPTSELWLTSTQTLHEQGVADEDMVVLKKKFFVEDDKVSRDDPVQLHLVYVQSRDAIVSGSHPCQLDESLQFAALQCQVQLGNYNAAVHKPGFLKLKEYVPPPILNKYKGPSLEKDLYNEHKKLVGMSEVNAKYRYVQLCRSLKTYGITFFHTKERVKGQKKPVAKMLGITRDAIIRLDFESKEVEHEYPLTHLKRWAASPASFTLDFGDYEDDYVSVITTEGEAISQLLAGYIDILLKKRKDTGVVLDENDNDVATVETVGRVRGQAGTAISTSSVAGYDSSQGRVGDLGFGGQPMARKGDRPKNDVTVTDIGSAQTAVANILNEMENPGLPVPGSMSSLTPQQWRQQLLTNANGVASAAGKLVGAVSGPGQLDRNALNNCAKEVALSVDQMAAAARGASLAEGEDPDGEMPLFDGAKQVADAVAKLLKASKDASLNPSDPQAKEALRTAQEALKNAGTYLAGACNGLLADSGTHKLLLESAKLIAAATNGLCNMAEQSAANIQDPGKRQQVQTAAKSANQAGLHNLTVTEVLAPAVLDPSCKRQIVESAKAVQSANAFLLASAKSAGMDPNAMDRMQEMARAVADAIGQLLGGTEMAEPRGGTDPEFAEAAKAISNAAATLISAQGNPALIQSAAGTVKTCEPSLIAGAKRAAGKADDDAVKQRILQMAKQVAEAVKGLTDVAGNAAANPSDQAAFQRLQDSARKLAALTSQLVGDAGKQAAMQQLRSNSKFAAAAATGLVAAARNAATAINDQTEQANLLNAAKGAAEAVNALMASLAHAQRHPDDPAAQQALMDAARKMAPGAYKLVAQAKSVAPSVVDPGKKQDMLLASNAAADAIKDLLNSATGASSAVGEQEFDEASEQFQAVMADLDAAQMFAQNGQMEALPGQTKDGAMDLLNTAVRGMGNAAKALVGAAKTNPDQLGPGAKDVASSVGQVVTAAKALAGSTNNRTTQKAILGGARELANASEAMVSCARSIASNPRDPALAHALTNAAKAVADALAKLIAQSKGADPGAKEAEEALQALQRDAMRINTVPVNLGGDFNGNSERLLQSTKAINAAIAQLLHAARNNPNGLGSAAKTTAATIPELVDAANAAAGSCPVKNVQGQIVNSTKALVGEVGKLIRTSQVASARQGDPDAESSLAASAKAVGNAVKGLVDSVQSGTPGQKEINDALAQAQAALVRLQTGELANMPPDVLDALSQAAKSMAENTAGVLTSRDNPEKLAAAAKKVANSLDRVVDNSKAAAAMASGQSSEGLEPLAKKLMDSCATLVNASNTPNLDAQAKKNIIGNAKNAAMATSSLVSAAKATAGTLKDNDLERSRAILNHAQNVANATAKLVNLSKTAAAGQPSPKVETAKAQKELADAVDHLLASSRGVSTVPSLDLGSLSPAAEALLAAARAIVHATNNLLDVAKPVVQGSKDPSSMNAMSNAVKSVTGGIQALMAAANGLKPGQKELDEAIEVIQATSVDLDSAALNAAIGSLENSAPPGKTAPKCQEEILESSKELAAAVKEVITAAKSAPENLGKAAKHTSDVVPRLATAAKQAAGLLRDNTQQQEQLASAKNVTDGVLELMCAAKEGNMNNIAQAAQAASLAINGLLTALKPSMAGSAASEEALAMVKDALANLGGPPQPQGRQRTYQECRDELTEICRSLATGISTLLTTSKTKPEDVGAVSKKIAAMIPGLVEMTKLAAAATSEAASKKQLLDSTDIANATAEIFARAKDAGADPKNAAVQQKMSGAVNAGTAAIARFVNALKAGAVGDREVEAAIDEMARMAADMDSASLFAAAGQLEPNAEAIGQTVEGLQAALVQAAKGIASSSAGVVAATKGTSEQLGTASKQLAAGLTRLSNLSKAAASLVGDSLSQQNILSGARAVCLTCQNMVVSARTAQKSPGDQTAQTALQGSSASVAEALKSFIENAQATNSEASRGLAELEGAVAEIRKMLSTFETPAFKGNMNATVDDVIASARALAESSAQLVSACNSNPEEISAATRSTLGSAMSLLGNAKGACRLTDDEVIKHNLTEAVKAVANSTNKLLNAAKQQRHDVSKGPEAQSKLSAAASDVVEKISVVVDAASDMPGGENAKKMWAQGENLEEMAEQELLAAASVIERATAALLAAKERAEQKRIEMGLQEADISEAILDAARAIAQATAVLVNSATACQKELVASGKGAKAASSYRRDPTWARGLISAAQAVAGTVQQLVLSANDSTQGTTDEESLVASSKAVAAATARLVAASRAKSDPLSMTQQRLTNAAKAVANATQQLVAAAKVATEDQERALAEERALQELVPLTANQAKVKEMEAQIKILKLQKELEAAQKSLFTIRKDDYKDTAEPAPAAPTPPSPGPARHDTPQRPAGPGPAAKKPAVAMAKPAPRPSKFYSVDELRKKPPTVDVTKLEEYLSDEDFAGVFKMTREEFLKVPAFKRNDLKKNVGLF
eukprot:TRINITY_DN236_c0_g1_i4.p1 TRINITY_DN236_c0_g1~~TRINITY_DN236_c0_g1_i4.p1  ORF type:complete len:2591 (+),score=1077.50 TRINITY_DN236_c0_g1_i4:231-8003(+)